MKSADLVLVLNDITIQHFEKELGVDGAKIHKITNGVNIHRYAPLLQEDVEKQKRSLGLEGKRVVFQVGSVCERKNQLGSVKMLKQYLQEHPDVVYMYAGGVIDAEYEKAIAEFAKANGISQQVQYAGELVPGEQLNFYYNIADCCVFTSTLESFGLVIIEAIASGTPVVLGENLMFDLGGGYRMYRSEEEFTALVDEVMQAGKKSRDEYADALNKYSWGAVALAHGRLFGLEKDSLSE